MSCYEPYNKATEISPKTGGSLECKIVEGSSQVSNLTSEQQDHVLDIIQKSPTKAITFDPLSIKCLRNILVDEFCIFSLKELPDGSLADLCVSGTRTKIWNSKTGTLLHTFGRHFEQLSDGTFAAGSNKEKSIQILDPKTQTIVRILKGHKDTITALEPLSKGIVASGSRDKTIKIWDHTSGTCLHTFKGHKKAVIGLKSLSDTTFASGCKKKIVKVWDLNEKTCLCTFKAHKRFFSNLKELSDGTFASYYGDNITHWDLKTGTCLHTFQHYAVSKIEPLLNGLLASVYSARDADDSGYRHTKIKIWDTKTRTCRHEFGNHADTISDLKNLSNGNFATPSFDNTISIWNPELGVCVSTLRTEESPNVLKEFSNGILFSGHFNGAIQIWDYQKGANLRTLREDKGGVVDIIQLPDGTFASASYDGNINIWG